MKKIILLTLYLIPVVLLIGFVANFSVNVPIDDEWRLAGLFDKIATGNVSFNDFWALHSNHRIIFPKIIIAMLAFVSRWNINYPLCLSIALAVITFVATYKLSSMQVKNVGDDLWHLANILTCILLCSLVQHENWLWGFQLAWFLVNLCFVSAVYCLSLQKRLLPSIKILIATGFCFIASFSLAQGLLSWLAAIPAVVALEGNVAQKRKRLIVWMLLFVATCAIYSIDYHPSRKTSIILLLNKPLLVIDYFLSLLGSPIVRSPVISALVGLAIFATFLFLAFHFGRKMNEHHEAIPWLSIGLFAVLSALFITAGRAQFGAIQAIESSRYTTNSILLLIALVQLGQLFVRGNIATLNRNYKFVYRVLAGGLIGIIIVNSGQAIAQTASALPYKQGGKDCLELINYLEPSDFFNNSTESCLRVLSKKTWLVREGAQILDKIGWRKLAKNVEFIANPGKIYGYFDQPQIGDKSLTINKDNAIKATGWAVLPEKLQQPNIVLLSVGDKPSFFANAYVNLDSPDIAKTLKSQVYSNARWAIDLAVHDLPIAQTEIKAWVYNPVDNQFVKLRGGARVTVEDEE
ncbi:MAG: hypothetical protein QQW96_21475 [Tychonema bourrellyi B0820]|uniref:Glycosyltransferase RgtA/B/C/D-like domain-containing protein n=1 Tax=Tychonema bourrellyi FEM_GT703 TaxID=2040638 RepID=A0A2G4F4J9_9CYAN|nr:hypothetical protein [Tychonema bourrellyi]MDQ2100207.1 hypothetical protein [Tychonema bourrellyi B0820]PHX56704.1 hypothetical protein CP500_004135 [Tychonema bourrellyi FEM_GT703]